MKRMYQATFAAAALYALAVTGCGGASSSSDPSSGGTRLVGQVGGDTPAGSVLLRDSGSEPAERATTADSSGAFTFDVAGLTPPFALRADSGDASQYAFALRAGSVRVDELSTTAVAAASREHDAGEAWRHPEHHSEHDLSDVFQALRTALAPLFDHYGITAIDDDGEDSAAVRKMLSEVRFSVKDGTITVTNRATGGVIFSAPLSNLASGVLHPENIPGGTPTPPPTACTYAYGPWGTCGAGGTQSRSVVSATPAGCQGTPVLTQACTPTTPPPSTCTTFTYSAWTPATCPASGQQTRTVASSSPSGCTGGSPVLTQTCTPTPPPPSSCTSFTYSAWGTCSAAGQQTRTVVSSSPSGCTGGSPVLTQACTPPPVACTSFTYSAWGTCSASGQQTRTVVSSSPSGCSGGSPVLTQTCTPPPVTCTSFTYNAWGTCSAAGQQTRTVASSSPSGCTGGSPVLTQACTPPPPPPDGAALYAASCAGCHGALASSSLKGKNISVSLIQSKGMTQGLTDAQLQAIVTAVGP